eukprot:TRINITY_DN4569_c0_g1_i1.p1 TRINITY_DN4569_c0_g1~~TRINITY_DN4569_c0_g1_i1.p1  ORF type:complete len:268 (+),score=61.29 TRINITY_DN4569_c0_g1_i1:48-851(+)
MAKRSALALFALLFLVGAFAVTKVVANDDVILSETDDEVIADPFATEDLSTEVEDAEFVEDAEAAAEGISHLYHILKYTDKKFPAGESIDFLVGISNPASESIVISAVQGFLTSPDFEQSYVNFTAFQFNTEVQPQLEASVFYRIRTVPEMETRSFGLIIVVAYHAAGNRDAMYQAIVFKDVVEIIEPLSSFDLQTALTYLVLLLVFGIAGFFAWNATTGSKKTRTPRPVVEQGTKSDVADLDWLQGTNAFVGKTKKTTKADKSKSA